jgi:hypothetical protein
VQAAGHLVSAAAEFAARVELGKDQVDRVASGLVVDADRNAAPVVADRNRIVRIDGNLYMRAETGKGFIYLVIHDLIDQMMKTSGRSRADIHSGTLSDCLKAFQHLDIICIIRADILCVFDVVVSVIPAVLGIFFHEAFRFLQVRFCLSV